VIDTRGWVTVPPKIRRRLGLSSGDRIEFVVEAERIVLRPLRLAANVLQKRKAAKRRKNTAQGLP
jgi:AbrB family looped-hinge helix DNA binding protein